MSEEKTREKSDRLRVVTVASRKGGVGKTTTVVNFGSGLSLKVAQDSVDAVVLVDADPSQGEVGEYLNLGQSDDFAAAFLGERPTLDCAVNVPGYERLYVIRGSAATARVDTKLAKEELPPAGLRFREILGELVNLKKDGQGVIVVFIDTGPGFNEMQSGALVAADYLLAPLTPAGGGLGGVSMMWKWYQELKETNQVNFGVLPVMFDQDNPRHGTMLANIARIQPEIGARLFPAIPYSDELIGVQDRGVTVWEDRKLARSLVGIRYLEALQHLATQLGITLALKKKEGGKRG